jgi:hypothetical protein
MLPRARHGGMIVDTLILDYPIPRRSIRPGLATILPLLQPWIARFGYPAQQADS